MAGTESQGKEETGVRVGREGGTDLFLPETAAGTSGPSRRRAIFYNPAMALSRDLSLGVTATEARALGRKVSFWDMTAATGARSMRLLQETDAIESLLATDINPLAAKVLSMNAEMEGSGRMRTRVHDSSNHPFPGQFDIVDIDPYGTPMPFLDTGLESVKPGGLLAVTATDMAVLAGPGKVTCGERYSAVPLRGYLSREAGLRILLATVARHAQRLNLDLAPVLSIISGYYVRVVVRVTESRWGGQEAHPAVNTLPFEGYTGPPLPTRNRVGPMWTGPLHDAGFVRNIPPLSNPGCGLKRFEMFLGTLKTEARVDVLFYYETGELARRLHLESPPRRDAILDSLKEGGYSAARTHASASGWRTNAPPEVVDSIVRSLDLHFP